MIIIYPFILSIFLISSIFNKSVRMGHFYRLGFKYPPKISNRSIWIHAASVGEVVVVKEVIENFISVGYSIYLSTTTSTGHEMASKMYDDNVIIFYNSLDASIFVRRLIKIISPKYMIIVEIEIWPSLIYEIQKKDIPLYLINGRIGFKELKGYENPIAKAFLKNYYKLYTKILAQSEIDKKNMITIGMPTNLITVTGNLKYDIEYKILKEKYDIINNIIPKDKYIIVIGSSHENEEELFLQAISDANIKDKVYVVIVPRNITRGKDIQNIAKKYNYNLSLYTHKDEITEDGIIIDIIGELLYWYKSSDIVIMGGSFSKNIQGHNILEAIYFKKPVIVGPYMSNFDEISNYMKESVFTSDDDIKKLSKIINNCYNDRKSSKALGIKANKLLSQNKGASMRTIDIIKSL